MMPKAKVMLCRVKVVILHYSTIDGSSRDQFILHVTHRGQFQLSRLMLEIAFKAISLTKGLFEYSVTRSFNV